MTRRFSPLRPGRRGSSLIELVIVVGLSTALSGAAIGMLHLLMRAERGGMKDMWHDRSLMRLAEAWRNDVHAARDARLDEGAPGGLRVELIDSNGRQITYEVRGDQVARSARRADGRVQLDDFHFPPGSTFHFEIDSAPRLARIVVRWPTLGTEFQDSSQPSAEPASTKADATHRVGRTSVIEALVARDRRFDREEATP